MFCYKLKCKCTQVLLHKGISWHSMVTIRTDPSPIKIPEAFHAEHNITCCLFSAVMGMFSALSTTIGSGVVTCAKSNT